MLAVRWEVPSAALWTVVYVFDSGHVLLLIFDKLWNLIGKSVVCYGVSLFYLQSIPSLHRFPDSVKPEAQAQLLVSASHIELSYGQLPRPVPAH